jgi:hypothetical protein
MPEKRHKEKDKEEEEVLREEMGRQKLWTEMVVSLNQI